MATLKITIASPDEDVLESFLNLAASGYDPSISFAFWALAKGLHFSHFKYYRDLIEEARG